VFADRFEYHFMRSEHWYPWRTLWSAYVEVDRDPPHAVREISSDPL